MQIRVDHRHGIACRMFQPCSDRNLMTEISGETHDANSWFIELQFPQYLRRFILAAVVHENQLESEVRCGKNRN